MPWMDIYERPGRSGKTARQGYGYIDEPAPEACIPPPTSAGDALLRRVATEQAAWWRLPDDPLGGIEQRPERTPEEPPFVRGARRLVKARESDGESSFLARAVEAMATPPRPGFFALLRDAWTALRRRG